MIKFTEPKPRPEARLQEMLSKQSPSIYTWQDHDREKYQSLQSEGETLKPMTAFQMATIMAKYDPSNEIISGIKTELQTTLFKIR